MTDQLTEEKKTARVLDAVADAHTALIDAVHGYDVMLEKAEAEISAILVKTREANQRQAEELHQFLVAQGRSPSDEGSFMSMVHEGVVRTRALIGDIDGDVLSAVADGERRLVSSYDDVLEKLVGSRESLPRDTYDQAHELVVRHRAEIEQVVADLHIRKRSLNS